MKHVVTTIIPDCPMCGQEMKILGRMANSKGWHRAGAVAKAASGIYVGD